MSRTAFCSLFICYIFFGSVAVSSRETTEEDSTNHQASLKILSLNSSEETTEVERTDVELNISSLSTNHPTVDNVSGEIYLELTNSTVEAATATLLDVREGTQTPWTNEETSDNLLNETTVGEDILVRNSSDFTVFLSSNATDDVTVAQINSSESWIYSDSSSHEIVSVGNTTEVAVILQTASSSLFVTFFGKNVTFATPGSVTIVDDAVINTALLSALIGVVILAMVSLCLIIAWRRWRSQLSGEWVLNKHSSNGVVGFENDCYAPDCSKSNADDNRTRNDFNFTHTRPIYDGSKASETSSYDRNRLQTRSSYDNNERAEMIEMIQKESVGGNEDLEA